VGVNCEPFFGFSYGILPSRDLQQTPQLVVYLPPLPQMTGSASLHGVGARVDVDSEMGVTHIQWTPRVEDLARPVATFMAQDRLGSWTAAPRARGQLSESWGGTQNVIDRALNKRFAGGGCRRTRCHALTTPNLASDGSVCPRVNQLSSSTKKNLSEFSLLHLRAQDLAAIRYYCDFRLQYRTLTATWKEN